METETPMANVRDTSLDAFTDIKPKLGKLQQTILEAIRKLGTPTDMEIATHLNMSIRTVGARRNELMNMGVITENEKRICSISKKTAYSWRIK